MTMNVNDLMVEIESHFCIWHNLVVEKTEKKTNKIVEIT
jgi:hypothetical protein